MSTNRKRYQGKAGLKAVVKEIIKETENANRSKRKIILIPGGFDSSLLVILKDMGFSLDTDSKRFIFISWKDYDKIDHQLSVNHRLFKRD